MMILTRTERFNLVIAVPLCEYVVAVVTDVNTEYYTFEKSKKCRHCGEGAQATFNLGTRWGIKGIIIIPFCSHIRGAPSGHHTSSILKIIIH